MINNPNMIDNLLIYKMFLFCSIFMSGLALILSIMHYNFYKKDDIYKQPIELIKNSNIAFSQMCICFLVTSIIFGLVVILCVM